MIVLDDATLVYRAIFLHEDKLGPRLARIPLNATTDYHFTQGRRFDQKHYSLVHGLHTCLRTVYAIYETPTIGKRAHCSGLTSYGYPLITLRFFCGGDLRKKTLGLLEDSHNLSSSNRRWPYVLHKLSITV